MGALIKASARILATVALSILGAVSIVSTWQPYSPLDEGYWLASLSGQMCYRYPGCWQPELAIVGIGFLIAAMLTFRMRD